MNYRLKTLIKKFSNTIRNTRYTLLIVPEGTSPVFRVKFRASYVFIGITILFLMTCSLTLLILLNQNHQTQYSSLQQEYVQSSDQLQNTVIVKEQTIETLQTELLVLSEQAKLVESKLSQLEQLESELQTLKGVGLSERTTLSSASNDLSEVQEELQGMGGEWIPINEQEVITLVEETKESISSSLETMPVLQTRLEHAKQSLEQYNEWLRITPTLWPTLSERITSNYGTRQDPFNGKLTYHSGLDIAGPIGDPVYAAADGIVVETGYNKARGNYVIINHASKKQTRYMHLQEVTTTANTKVVQGDQIGILGSTGRSTGPHLHVEVYENGQTVDPINYLIKPGEEEDES